MPFRVSGKNIDIGQALRARVNARIAEVTAKYFDGGFSGHVTIGKEGFGFRTDCVVHLDSGIVLEADALAADAYASADQAALRLEKRLRRYKHRLKDHQVARAAGRPADDRPPDRARNQRAELCYCRTRARQRRGGDAVEPSRHRGIDHRIETAFGQRGRHGTRHERARRSWSSVTLDMAGSIWFTAARTVTSAGSICRPSNRTPIDGQPAPTYGPPPLRRRPLLSSQFSGTDPCCSPISSRPTPSFRR